MAQYFSNKSSLVEDMLLDMFDGTLYLFPLEGSLEALEALHKDLVAFSRYALVVPSQWLQCKDTVLAASLSRLNIIEAVLQFHDSEHSLLLAASNKTDERVLLCSLALQQLDDSLADKIVGCYHRMHSNQQPYTESVASPVCYAGQFLEPSTGVLVDALAYVAGHKELASKNYSLNPQLYL